VRGWLFPCSSSLAKHLSLLALQQAPLNSLSLPTSKRASVCGKIYVGTFFFSFFLLSLDSFFLS
jgi:hypothetical protein